eukprot:TRINITY_DN2797_c0_g1_i2.p3 TRINITY_DN2797_c0_g1~~TRINITY_DN2797_c0_g1_i2.p3  ORF type:complete len:102 (-),score=25.42 TRINITY_DN2797_c0_g1_i2:67-372(-)
MQFNFFFFFSSRRRHTRCREVSWARRCVQETVFPQGYTCPVVLVDYPSILFSSTGISPSCLLYTSDAADDTPCVDLGGRRIIKKKKKRTYRLTRSTQPNTI